MKKSRRILAAIGLSMALIMPAASVLGVVKEPVSIEAYAKKERTKSVEERIAFAGDSFKLEAGKGKASFSTSNKKIATVNKKGKVKVLAKGKVRITVKSGKQVTVYKLTVKEASEKVRLSWHFADKEEGIQCRLSNEKYLNGLNQEDLNFRTQKKGATLEEFKAYSAAQVREFTGEEKEFIEKAMKEIEDILNQRGYKLPVQEDIIFIKTTMEDEGGAAAYTSQNQIYLQDDFLSQVKGYEFQFEVILCHEMFHCLTRQNADFKAKIYGVIGAEVMEKEIEFPKEVREKLLSNPDVESFDSYATFTINGEKKKCVVFPYLVRGFEKKGDSFFDAVETKLMPIDDTSKLYSVKEATDFWEVFGKNTDYILAIEETMADNFSYAVMLDQEEIKRFPNPEILQEIQKRISEQ